MRHPLCCRLLLTVYLHAAFEKAVDEREHIRCVYMLTHADHQAIMVDAVEERL